MGLEEETNLKSRLRPYRKKRRETFECGGRNDDIAKGLNEVK